MYIEGYNFAEDHHGSEFYSMLGCHYENDGNEASDIWKLTGRAGTFTDGIDLDYGHITSPRTRQDIISASEGQLVFDQDDVGYAVAYSNGNYRVIVSSFMFGAIIDGEGMNNKIDLMNKYLDYLENTTAVDENQNNELVPENFLLSSNFPNPFSYNTNIQFKLFKREKLISVTVYNLLGEEIKKLVDINIGQNGYSAIWDGTDKNNSQVPAGTYIYQIQAGNRAQSRKMILIK